MGDFVNTTHIFGDLPGIHNVNVIDLEAATLTP